jgi:hypothetical protein
MDETGRGISRESWIELFYWVTRAAILFLFPLYISDISLYRSYANRAVEGHLLVYRDFPFEYPPLAFVLLWIPAFILNHFHLSTDENYRILFGLLLLPFDHWIFQAHLRRDPRGRSALLYLTLTALLPYLLFDRFDVAVGFFFAYPFLAAASGEEFEPVKAALAWGVGGAFKLVPLIPLPLAIMERGLPRTGRALLVALAGLPLLLSLGLAYRLGHGNISFFSHHSDRGVQVESIYACAVFFARAWLGMFREVNAQTNFGAQHLNGLPWIKPLASWCFLLGMGTTLIAVLFFRWKGRISAAAGTWLLVLTLILVSYVLSTQFLFWLLPLAPLISAELRPFWRRAFLALLWPVVLLTSLHFRIYWSYAAAQPWPVLVLVLRNLLLAALLGVSWLGFLASAQAAIAPAVADPLDEKLQSS